MSKGNKIMNEFSDTLKKTIKKYNEISIDNDISLKNSNENYDDIYQSKNSGKINSFNSNDCPYFKEANTTFYNSNYNNAMNNVNTGNLFSANNEIEQRQNSFVQKINKVIENLNTFENELNEDFDDLIQFIENSIEKELTKTNH